MVRNQSSKSIAELEATAWPIPGPRVAPLFAKCYELRQLPLSRLTPGDWRTLIGQDIGLTFLMPMAINVVEKDPLIQVEHYRGDLLAAMLRASPLFFSKNPDIRSRVEGILESLPSSLQTLDFIDFDTSHEALEEATSIFQKGLSSRRADR